MNQKPEEIENKPINPGWKTFACMIVIVVIIAYFERQPDPATAPIPNTAIAAVQQPYTKPAHADDKPSMERQPDGSYLVHFRATGSFPANH